MGTLQLFPEGCGGCGGKCCKHVANGAPPWTRHEFGRLGKLLPHAHAIVEYAYTQKRERRPAVAGTCFRLSPDGLCGLEEQGLQQPKACVENKVGGEICLEARERLVTI